MIFHIRTRTGLLIFRARLSKKPVDEDPDATYPFCPLSCKAFAAPAVVLPSGYSFEASTLPEWLEIAPTIKDKLAENRAWGKAREKASSVKIKWKIKCSCK